MHAAHIPTRSTLEFSEQMRFGDGGRVSCNYAIRRNHPAPLPFYCLPRALIMRVFTRQRVYDTLRARVVLLNPIMFEPRIRTCVI